MIIKNHEQTTRYKNLAGLYNPQDNDMLNNTIIDDLEDKLESFSEIYGL